MAVALALAVSAVDEPRDVVWAVGDGADGTSVARRLARRIERDHPAAFLYLGDVYPHGTAEDFERNYRSVYGRLDRITWPTPGNHEWWARESAYFPYWAEHGRARPWYRKRLAGWELLSLNSEAPHTPGSPQLRWLDRRLSGSAGTCRIAFWHRPRFSGGGVHGDARDVTPFWRALRGKARIVINGHEHALMRYRRRAGITEYVAGAGGRVRYTLASDRRLAFGRSDRTGALRLALRPGAATVEFRSVDGELLDRSRVRCDPAGRLSREAPARAVPVAWGSRDESFGADGSVGIEKDLRPQRPPTEEGR